MIVVGVLTDGRDGFLAATLASAREHLTGFDHLYVVHDDFNRKGLAGAVQTLWAHALGVGADYLFHLEDDWLFTAPVDIEGMRTTLDANAHLAQLVLQRNPLTSDEHRLGGVAAWPDWTQRDGYVEQTSIFSLNPCLIPRDVLSCGWDNGNEAGTTERLKAKGYRFGFWGEKQQPPAVIAAGAGQRTAAWSL